jgi:hypothetical protein
MKIAVYKAKGQPPVLEDWPQPQPAAGKLLVRDFRGSGRAGEELPAMLEALRRPTEQINVIVKP